MVVRWDVVLTTLEYMKKAFGYIALMFIIIFWGFIFSNHFIYSVKGQYFENYLSIYTNAHDLLFQKTLPMWSFNFFLGGNFLGAQNVYSVFNPFFLLTLPFSTSLLPKLYFPLLLLKTLLATWSLSLYMRQTKWFKGHTILVASILYLYNGWYLSNLSEFVTIELLFFVPLVLYGIEKLLSSGRKRYFVATYTIMLLSHFTFTALSLPFFIVYIFIRLKIEREKSREIFVDDVKKFFISTILIAGINMIFILPLCLALNAMSIELREGITLGSLLGLFVQGLFPPFHESFKGSIMFAKNISFVPLYQSALVVLIIPQFIKLVSKEARRITVFSYILILMVVFLTQSLELVNVTSLAPLNTNVISIFLILFNTLIVAYVFNDLRLVNINLLRQTTSFFKELLLIVLGGVFLFQLYLKHPKLSSLTGNDIIDELIVLSPYLMLGLMIIFMMKLYRVILSKIVEGDQTFSWKTIVSFLMIECIVVSSIYFATNQEQSVFVKNYMVDEQSITNKTYAVINYLQAIDPEFYRIINSYEIQYNEPLYQGYNGFSIANPYLVSSSHDVSWMLDERVKKSLSISAMDYMLTTALSAKYYFTADYEVPLPGYQYYDRISGITIYENEYFIPVGTSSLYYVLESEFNKLNRQQQHYVFLKCIILEDERLAQTYGLQSFDLTLLPENLGEIEYFEAAQMRQMLGAKEVRYEPNKIKHDYVTSSKTLLTYSIPYNEGWRAFANGKEVPIYEVNDGFIGIGLSEGGEYEIELIYCSPGFGLGFSVSAITCLIILANFYHSYDRRKKIASM